MASETMKDDDFDYTLNEEIDEALEILDCAKESPSTKKNRRNKKSKISARIRIEMLAEKKALDEYNSEFYLLHE